MKALKLVSLAALAFVALPGPQAHATFGIFPGSLDGSILGPNGEPYSQAAGHPTSAGVRFAVNTTVNAVGEVVSDEADIREVITDVPPGLVGNPNATPKCDREFFFNHGGLCPASTQIGVSTATIYYNGAIETFPSSVYNLNAPQGVPAEFGFSPGGAVTIARPNLRSDGDYGITVRVTDIPQAASLLDVSFTLWGLPADDSHDAERGVHFASDQQGNICGFDKQGLAITGPPCPSDAPLIPFFTNPSDCSHGPFETKVKLISWQGHEDEEVFISHDSVGNPLGVTGCETVPFSPEIKATPTSQQAEAAAGLNFELKMPTDGLLNPKGTAQAHIKRARVTLPEGVTVNPSSAEGLSVCSPEDFKKETAASPPGAGCPDASKIGDVTVNTPLLDVPLGGSLHVAQPDDPSTAVPGSENPFDTLIAIYLIAKSPERGILIKMAGKVEPDPKTGQLITTFDNLPQQPFSTFKLRFREGARAPLVAPPLCGNYTTVAEFTPWSASDPDAPAPHEVTTTTSDFQVTRGPDGGPCPTGGRPPFAPDFSAGTLNNNAGSYSPFLMRLSRRDGEQSMTRFSANLPPGVTAKLAGVSECSEAGIAAAKAKTGREELASPSCPANSQIGRALAGAGVGSVLTYVGSKLYLAGPFAGAPLSVVAITPAVAGPFDVGTVVVREALSLDPRTAAARVDGSRSDPIPHILAGIPLRLRDLRIYADRPEFTLNPTNCNPFAVGAELFGSGLDVFNAADDAPVRLSDRFQAANCSSLGFKPKLKLRLIGTTKRRGHPALRAEVRARPGDANFGAVVTKLPRSAFLDQSRIRTVCTRVQFGADQCPSGSVYGRATAITPLLDGPLEGLVYLRSSDNQLPDLVIALRGKVDIDLVGRIDSVHKGIRTSFESTPDAPVSRFILEMQGGAKGLIINSRNLCKAPSRAAVRFEAQNGARLNSKPLVKSDCPKGNRAKKRG
jgi:hypothetical protein